MSNLITLTTDFGLGEYAAAMKGVILGINSDLKIVDITHRIEAHNIREGAYVMYSTAPYFPEAIHVGVVDPGVGTDRKGLIIKCEKSCLVGPDNGLLIPCARRLGIKKTYEISNDKYLNETISNTFHGRDIFAPVAAYISNGVTMEDLGTEISDFVDLNLEEFKEGDGSIYGKYLYMDRFENLIFSIPKEIVLKHFKFGDEIKISFQNRDKRITRKIPLLPSYAHQEPYALLATISSSGFLEIACNQFSARRKLQMTRVSEIVLWY